MVTNRGSRFGEGVSVGLVIGVASPPVGMSIELEVALETAE
jgi:hypothetical protein